MKRRKLDHGTSKRIFKKNVGVHRLNAINPRRMRGGIRL